MGSPFFLTMFCIEKHFLRQEQKEFLLGDLTRQGPKDPAICSLQLGVQLHCQLLWRDHYGLAAPQPRLFP